jgi:lipopolysaccharide/colanic/teichoic acid biosynthesis glycosyltransferase
MPFEEWVDTDIEYIRKRSVWLDLKLMFKTFTAVVKRKGAR